MGEKDGDALTKALGEWLGKRLGDNDSLMLGEMLGGLEGLDDGLSVCGRLLSQPLTRKLSTPILSSAPPPSDHSILIWNEPLVL